MTKTISCDQCKWFIPTAYAVFCMINEPHVVAPDEELWQELATSPLPECPHAHELPLPAPVAHLPRNKKKHE